MNIYLVVSLSLIVIYFVYSDRTLYKQVPDGPREWSVAGSYDNSHDAGMLLSRLHSDIIYFTRKMREKYQVDLIWDTARKSEIDESDRQKIIKALIKNYNADMIFENDPQKSADTAYTINKGDSLYFCLRNRKDPQSFIPYNTMMFALLHELSHMANYNAWGHTTRFWEVFAFVLKEARDVGIYSPEDYSANPKVYCGLTINYNPLYDKNVASAI